MVSRPDNFSTRHFKEVLESIKEIDVEEKFDLYFSRFFGLFFAKWGRSLRLTPTHVTFISLGVGVIGGIMLYWQSNLVITATGCFLISLAGILDSADGQLARLTGTSSDFGRMVDGTIDNFVFAACYIAGGLHFLGQYHFFYFLGVGMLAGLAHSLKAASYEFYKTEYLELVSGQKDSCIPYQYSELKIQGPKWYHKVIHHIILDYTKKQLWVVSRSPEQRQIMRQLATNPKYKTVFIEKYRTFNRPLLSWWAVFCGTNTHRTALMVLALFGRFDIYFFASLAWTVFIIPISIYQSGQDRKLLSHFGGQ